MIFSVCRSAITAALIAAMTGQAGIALGRWCWFTCVRRCDAWEVRLRGSAGPHRPAKTHGLKHMGKSKFGLHMAGNRVVLPPPLGELLA